MFFQMYIKEHLKNTTQPLDSLKREIHVMFNLADAPLKPEVVCCGGHPCVILPCVGVPIIVYP